MPVRTAYDPTAAEILTATNLEKLAGGWIGYAEVTAAQGSITTEVDLTSLTVTVTVNTSRRIRITGHVDFASTVASDTASLVIKEGGTTLTSRARTLGGIGISGALTAMVVLTPSSGSHTYKLTGARAAGSGSVSMEASASKPAFILVEDLGPSA